MGAKYQSWIIVCPINKVLYQNAISTIKFDLNRKYMNGYWSNLHNLTSKIGRTQKRSVIRNVFS